MLPDGGAFCGLFGGLLRGHRDARGKGGSESITRFIYIAAVLTMATAMAQAPDNSEVNKRDNVKDAVTAGTQSNSKADLALTRNIRQGVAKNKTMSTYARNIKIISRDGAVTLRGPVKSVDEKALIEGIADKIAGAAKVENLLEIAPAN